MPPSLGGMTVMIASPSWPTRGWKRVVMDSIRTATRHRPARNVHPATVRHRVEVRVVLPATHRMYRGKYPSPSSSPPRWPSVLSRSSFRSHFRSVHASRRCRRIDESAKAKQKLLRTTGHTGLSSHSLPLRAHSEALLAAHPFPAVSFRSSFIRSAAIPGGVTVNARMNCCPDDNAASFAFAPVLYC